MLCGELMNSLTAFVLTSTLFVVFCREESAVELVIKSIAVNFVVSIDNEWTSEQMRAEALRDFEEFQDKIEEWDEEADEHGVCRNAFHLLIKLVCCFVRVFGTLIIGALLAFVFLFAHQGQFCNEVRRLDPGLIC